MKHFVTTTAALLLLSLSSWAGYEGGAVAFDEGDFEAALAEWRPLADQGHAQAQHNVGVMYATGQGVSQSFDEARKWLLRAAEQGLGQAAKSLGTTYSKGHGVEKDLVQAYTWFEIAETLGDKVIRHRVSLGVPNDTRAARSTVDDRSVPSNAGNLLWPASHNVIAPGGIGRIP